MKKIFLNITLIVSIIVMSVIFGFFLYDLIGLFINNSVVSPYIERFIAFCTITLIGIVLCIISLVFFNKKKKDE